MTEQFWNSVADIYAKNDLTTHSGDHELNHVIDTYTSFNQVNNLICLGVADGCRDPISILKTRKDYPQNILLNDFSKDLLAVCEKTMNEQFPQLEPFYLCSEMKNVTVENKFQNGVAIHGVYNANYIKPSINIYCENHSVIGSDMQLGWIGWNGTNIYNGDEIVCFNNSEYSEKNQMLIDKFISSRDKNFLAFSVKTETGFISHYYDASMLYKVFEYVYPNKNFQVIEKKERYILAEITFGDVKMANTFITSLNNVLGNIPIQDQIASLQAVKQLFV